MMMKAVFRVWGVIAMIAVVSLYSARAATVPVNIINFSFQPASVTLNVGDTVTWTQKDTTQHTSTSDLSVWNSPFLSLSQTFSHTFDSAGDFPYHCTPHPFMTGSVSVQGAPPPPVNQPPTVSISSPANGATVNPPVTIQADASDPDGTVAKVQFFAGRTSLGEATSAPYQITVSLAPGTYNVTAQATDNQGATGSSSVVTITVTAPVDTPPTVSVSNPSDGATFTAPASITLVAQAADADGSVSAVEFFSGDTSLGVVTSSPFQFDWINLPTGSYTVTAKATDNAGLSTVSGPVHITVNAPVTSAQPSLSNAVKTTNNFQFTVSGTSGRTYVIQASSDLSTWADVKSVTAQSDTFTFSDTPPADANWRFYRVKLPQ